MSWRGLGPYLLVGAFALLFAGAVWGIATLSKPTPISEARARGIAIDWLAAPNAGGPRPWAGKHDWTEIAAHYQRDDHAVTDSTGRLVESRTCPRPALPWGGCGHPVWVVELREASQPCSATVTIDAIAARVQSASVGCGPLPTPP